ncbi:MAG TPA: hypothetical protein PLW68_05200 [Casimicrobiaceae bacterium]|nr:hypothetical protein [Casimicrobiaceae bacterium]
MEHTAEDRQRELSAGDDAWQVLEFGLRDDATLYRLVDGGPE